MRFDLHKVLICATVALIVACSVIPSEGLDPRRTNSEYARERWGSEEGFPATTVSAFAQTPDGYLWIGTDKGVIRFDGLDFRVFQQAIPSSLPIGPVRSLLTDSDGNLWILLQSTKILRYRDGKFEPGRDQTEYGITAMCKRNNGSILFSSLSYGTLTYRNERFETIASSPEETRPDGETRQAYDDTSTRFASAPDINQRVHSLASAVVAAAENPDGKVWLGTLDSGLFDIADGKISAVARLGVRITSILPLNDQKFWIGTENGVMEWNGTRLTDTDVPNSLRQTRTLAMIQDRDSNIWVGTSHGLLRFNSNGASSAAKRAGAISGPVTALFEDREGNLWVGGLGSIERLRDSVFITYPVSSLQTESGGPIFVDGEGRTWFAPFEGGLHWAKDDKQESVSKDGLAQDVIYSIAGGKDELWLGRRRGGLTHLLYASGSIWTKTYTQADGLAQNSVYAVYQDRNGAIWAATVNAGVSKYWKGRFTTYSKANGMASDTVFSIEESPDGTMWFATPNGLNAFANGEWRAYTTREGLPSDHVTCLLSDSSGTLWIGTRAGLAYLRSGHIQNVSVPSLQQEILGVAADDIGNFWIATSNHILSVKRERLLSTTLTESDLRNYALEDGLAGTQGVKRFRSVVRGPQGRIWFSTNRGLSVVDPTRTGPEPTHVTVQIEGFSADGNSLDLQAPIRVPPDTHRLIFRFSGLNLSDPKRIQFKYKLEGFDRDWSEPGSTSGIDKDWHEAGTRRQAFYMNLAPRKYTFHVIASNSEGVWNEAGASLDFSVQPAWYQTIWFRVSCLGAFFLMLWAAYQLRLQQMERQFNIRLEERVGERSRIARDLHDTLLQSFHGLLLRFQTAFSLLPERPDEAKQSLGSAIDQAALAITEGRDAVQNLRSSAVETNDLAVAIRAVGEELSAGETNRNTPVFQVEVEGTPRSLHLILRDEIYRIAAEALRNAFRHAQARRIEVELRYDDTQFRLRIRDDGKGIKPKVLGENGYAGHYGLPGMRERAKLVGGKLTVWSEHDSGTEIELTIPATAAYAASSRRSWWLEKFPGKGTSETDTRMRS